jgi:hypothetical protein
MKKKTKQAVEETELINDPGMTLEEEVAHVLEDNGRKKKGKSLILFSRAPNPKRKSLMTTEVISSALITARGKVSYAAVVLDTSPNYLRQRIRDNEELVSLQEEIREHRLDVAESKLDQRVLKDKWPAIQFSLETQGKHRGYTKRTEVTGAGGDRLVFEFSDGKKEEL